MLNLYQVSKKYKINRNTLVYRRKMYNIPCKKEYTKKEIAQLLIPKYDVVTKYNDYSYKTELMILNYLERFPSIDAQDISRMFCINIEDVIKTLKKEYLIIPSKINK